MSETTTKNDAEMVSPGFVGKFLALAGPYWTGEQKWKAWWLTGALIVLTGCQVLIPVGINLWSQKLFDALEARAMERILPLVGMLGGIILANMVVTTTHLRFRRRLQVGWRDWVSRRVLNEWMRRGRHYLVGFMPGEHDNPDGRIAEDIRITTEYAVDLAHSLLYCLALLASFTHILWSLSGTARIALGGVVIPIPGYLVWLALAYAAVGTTVAVLLGRPLVRAVNNRQTREADFRFGLVRVRESSEAVALIKGETLERRRLIDLFSALKAAWDRQTRALVHIFLFTSSYSVLSTAFPLLVAAPRFITGEISLGVLMQTAQAFQQMQAALSWPIDNLAKAAEWKASVERILGLRDALSEIDLDLAARNGDRLTVVTGAASVLAFRDVSLASPDGNAVIIGFSAEITLGEHVLISGDPSAALTLFKAAAGLWPWGRGQIELPVDGAVFFMPQNPYFPQGKLRGAVAYPAEGRTFADEDIREALERVELSHLTQRLDDEEAWEKVLPLDVRQRLGFVRLLLHRPNWIFIQEATDAQSAEGEAQLMAMLNEMFEDATVLTVSRHAGLEVWHRRKLVLTRSDSGLILVKDRRKIRRPSQSTRLYDRLAAVLKDYRKPAPRTGGECFIGDGEQVCEDETLPPPGKR